MADTAGFLDYHLRIVAAEVGITIPSTPTALVAAEAEKAAD